MFDPNLPQESNITPTTVMLTVKFIVRKNKQDVVKLRITNNRRSAEISLGVQLSESDLKNALSDSPRRELLPDSRWLHLVLSKVNAIKFDLLERGCINADVHEIAELIRLSVFGEPLPKNTDKKNTLTDEGEFVTWFKRFADTHREKAKTRSCYLHTLSRLKDYCPDLNKLEFGNINVAWLDGFDGFLSKTVGVNGRNHHMRNIRAVFKYAIRNDLDIRNPFDRMRLKTEPTPKRSLTIDQLRLLLTYDVLPYAEIYRDIFALTFMLIGINTADLFELNELSADGRVEYRRAKTSKLYSIKVEPEAMVLIKKYKGAERLLCLSERWKTREGFAAGCNTALKAIGAPATAPGRGKMGKSLFPELTIYWARHTWATIAADLDIPDATISLALGHGGENRVTDIYIKRNLRKVDDANRKVLDWVLYGKR